MWWGSTHNTSHQHVGHRARGLLRLETGRALSYRAPTLCPGISLPTVSPFRVQVLQPALHLGVHPRYELWECYLCHQLRLVALCVHVAESQQVWLLNYAHVSDSSVSRDILVCQHRRATGNSFSNVRAACSDSKCLLFSDAVYVWESLLILLPAVQRGVFVSLPVPSSSWT